MVYENWPVLEDSATVTFVENSNGAELTSISEADL